MPKEEVIAGKTMTNFRRIKKDVFLVEVCEGKGTQENPFKLVQYVYDDEIGKIIGTVEYLDFIRT